MRPVTPPARPTAAADPIRPVAPTSADHPTRLVGSAATDPTPAADEPAPTTADPTPPAGPVQAGEAPRPGGPFADPDAVARYAEGPPRLVPGFASLHPMVDLLLAERVGADGRVLVLGAGGGLELAYLAGRHPGWRFCGVDPSRAMLDLAARAVDPHGARIDLREGTIDAAAEGPFDGATCLLTLHFVQREERAPTLRELRRRLRPGAPLVVVHHSVPGGPAERERWFGRFAAFAIASGTDPARARAAGEGIGARLPILDPTEDERTFAEAGFRDVTPFFAALTFRGWVMYA